VVELLLKKCFPHLVLKGMTLDQLDLRFAAFCARAKRLGLRLLSIDMSAMDSSWNPHNRTCVRRMIKAVVDRLESLVEASVQEDPTDAASEKFRWILRHIIVELKAVDAILFSGERLTSVGNRLLMLLMVASEFLKVYGEEKGEQKIRDMFKTPANQTPLPEDDHAHGDVEAVNPVVDFGDNPDMDICTGDGDDLLWAVPKEMYASETELQANWEDLYKLAEVCSNFDEFNDSECLSRFCISSKTAYYGIAKVKRNAGRIIAHKIDVPGSALIANGCYTYTPTWKQWCQIATELWQRSYAEADDGAAPAQPGDVRLCAVKGAVEHVLGSANSVLGRPEAVG
jgi:hypothetical protein